jgi:LEA14-like dessication related protein
MNPKIFVGIAVAALVAILGGILLMGPTMVVESQNETSSETQSITKVEPLQIELEDISVTKISARSAAINIAFKISNPNPTAVIVQTMDYQLFETGYSDSEQISGGEIGSRPTGMVEFGSNYYVLLGENSITLKETIALKNSGNTPELWTSLEDNTATWRVTGDVFYNLSSMTSGQENELHFEFTK